MKKVNLILLLLLVLCSKASAINVTDSIVKYYQQFPQEKVFVHTDRDVYMAGDTVWFRAYLVDAMTRETSMLSHYIYVELYDDMMMPVEKHMVKRDSAFIFANALKLNAKLHTGSYTLVAYTQWMENFSNKRYFYKHLTIADRKTNSFTAKKDSDIVMYVSTLPTEVQPCDIKIRQDENELYIDPGIKGESLNDYALAIYGNGNLVVLDSITKTPCVFEQKYLHSGAMNIAIVNNKTGKVVSERVAFIHGLGLPDVKIKTKEKDNAVKVNIDVTNIVQRPLAGTISVSVTDASVMVKDTTQQDIATYLLAGSESGMLNKDIIECCHNQTAQNVSKLDNFLSTMYPRFSMSNILNGVKPTILFNIQKDQRISGTIQGTIRKKMKSPVVWLCSYECNYREQFTLPSNGHFNLTGMDFQEGINFIVEGVNHNGSHSLVEVTLDTLRNKPPFTAPAWIDYELIPDEFLKMEHMHAQINGIHEMNYLEEVEVKGNKSNGMYDYDKLNDQYMRLYTEPYHNTPYNVHNFAEWLSSRGLWDEIEFRKWLLTGQNRRNSPISPFAEMDYGSGLSRHYEDEALGAESHEIDWAHLYPTVSGEPLAIKTTHPMGYMPPVSAEYFNHPLPEGMSDRRCTVYWSPNMTLGADGKASFSFYPSSDITHKYRITIQGLADDGSVISKEIEILLRN